MGVVTSKSNEMMERGLRHTGRRVVERLHVTPVFPGVGQRFRRADADEQRAGEAGPVRHGDRIQPARAQIRLRQRRLDHRQHRREVLARRHLRHDAAVAVVQRGLRCDHVGEQPVPVLDDGGRGLVAGRFDPEDLHGAGGRGGSGVR